VQFVNSVYTTKIMSSDIIFNGVPRKKNLCDRVLIQAKVINILPGLDLIAINQFRVGGWGGLVTVYL
jgi:hypothetical protein